MKAVALVLTMLAAAAVAPAAADEPCIDCLRFRLDPPEVVRGPFPDELDNAFAMLRLKDGGWRGFSANANTFAIDGATMADMAGPRKAVLRPGPKGSASDCGRWLNSVLPVGDAVYGLVHQEAACNYRKGETHKTMAVARSRDEGLTWEDLGNVIVGPEPRRPGAVTGEGDCTMVDGRDGFAYAYCLRNSDSRTIAARAPLADLGPGNWRKFADGRWDVEALGGDASAIGFFGKTSAYLKSLGQVALLVGDRWFGGLRLSLAGDKATFASLKEPLLPMDATDWRRPAPTDLIAYVGVLDPVDGSNVVGDDFVLAMVYIAPGDTFAHRYLAMQPVRLALSDGPALPQVGLALGRWRSAADGSYRTSTGPVVDRDFVLDRRLGYLMTRAPDHAASVRLEECLDGRDYRLDIEGSCDGSGATRLRTAGWAYDSERPGTLPLYRCRADGTSFVSNAPDCEGKGAVETRLGFVLAE